MNLEELRKKVDEADAQIIELLDQRYAAVAEIGRIKRSGGHPVYVPEREKIIYDKVAALNHGRMNDLTLHAVYREIMSGALAIEQPLKIVYPAPEDSFTHLALLSRFGSSMNYSVLDTVDEVFASVADGRADYGCIAFEELPSVWQSDVHICAGISLRNKAGKTMQFFVIGKQISEPTGNDRTVLCFTLKTGAGELSDILSSLKNKVLSVHQQDGMFFVELQGHQNDLNSDELHSAVSGLHILGSYPAY